MKKHLVMIDVNSSGMDAVARALELGYVLSIVEPDETSWYRDTEESRALLARTHRHFKSAEYARREDLFAVLRTIDAELKIDAVIGLFDRSIELAADAAAELGLLHTSPEVVRLCTNKYEARKRLDQFGFRNARCERVGTLDEARAASAAIGYPVILKPVSGAGSLFCCKANSPSDVDAYWGSVAEAMASSTTLGDSFVRKMQRGLVVEEYLIGEMVSVEIARADSDCEVLMISGRVRSTCDELVDYRIDMPAQVCSDQWQACSNYAREIVQALDLKHGVFHIELILTADGPVCVEINPRLMGGLMPALFTNFTGSNIYDRVFDLHLGRGLGEAAAIAFDGVATTVRLESARAATLARNGVKDIILDCDSRPLYLVLDETMAAGDAVAKGHVLGRFQLAAPSHAALDATVDAVMSRVARDCGLELVR
jgi:biotin carboxylase